MIVKMTEQTQKSLDDLLKILGEVGNLSDEPVQ